MTEARLPRVGWALLLALGCWGGAVGCTVVSRETGPGEVLVAEDAPVFDDAFRDLEPEDLDLSRFWTEPATRETRDPVPLHSLTVSELAARVSPAVVNLYTVSVEKREVRIGVHPNDLLPFRLPVVSTVLDFVPFQLPIPFRAHGYSLGSGFLINEEGFVLTNAHVVENAVGIRAVRLGGNEEVEARIVGRDPLTDLALLRIPPPDDGASLPLARSGGLAVGEFVVAVGNPLGLAHSVTLGVVSAVERVVPTMESGVLDFVQTDAAINPGNSGGPLLNLRGEVVGINTAMAAEAQAIGFAVPVDIVKAVMPLLVVDEPGRGWLGASVRPVLAEDRKTLGPDAPAGVVVTEVVEDGPAAAAGLAADDRIVAIDGVEIDRMVAFRRAIVAVRPGDPMVLDVVRASERLTVKAVLGTQPRDRG
jgi:serine protease Do